MEEVDAIYLRIAEAQDSFRAAARAQAAGIACPQGCGACCVTFIPDVMPLEAQRLALHLLTERQDELPRLEAFDPASDRGCPFWHADRPGENCGVYPARPLICRLFGFSAMRNKHGAPEFTLCRHMEDLRIADGGNPVPRRLAGKALEEAFGRPPPVMADFAADLAALDPQESGRRQTLPEALAEALPRVSMLLGYALSDSTE